MRKEGTMPVSPIAAALSDDDVLPVRGLSYFFGATSGGGEIPVSVQDYKKTFFRNNFLLIHNGSNRDPDPCDTTAFS